MLDPECIECGSFCNASKIAGLVKCSNCGRLQPGVTVEQQQSSASASIVHQAMSELGHDVPDYAEVMVGWRAWQVRVEPEPGEEGLLWSVTHPEFGPWVPREPMIAECPRAGNVPTHEPPVPHCKCGVYAARNRSHLVRLRYHRFDTERRPHWCVIGTVSLYGGVIPGSQGWKAGKAYPREILVPHEAWRIAKPITEKYGVPVRLENTLKTPMIVQH